MTAGAPEGEQPHQYDEVPPDDHQGRCAAPCKRASPPSPAGESRDDRSRKGHVEDRGKDRELMADVLVGRGPGPVIERDDVEEARSRRDE